MGIDGIHELDNPGNETPTQKALREYEEKLLDETMSRRRRIGKVEEIREDEAGLEIDVIKHERNIFADPPRDRPTGGTSRKPRV